MYFLKALLALAALTNLMLLSEAKVLTLSIIPSKHSVSKWSETSYRCGPFVSYLKRSVFFLSNSFVWSLSSLPPPFLAASSANLFFSSFFFFAASFLILFYSSMTELPLFAVFFSLSAFVNLLTFLLLFSFSGLAASLSDLSYSLAGGTSCYNYLPIL